MSTNPKCGALIDLHRRYACELEAGHAGEHHSPGVYWTTPATETDEERTTRTGVDDTAAPDLTWTVASRYPARFYGRQCHECGRVFHLDDENDAAEFAAGHDCEALV